MSNIKQNIKNAGSLILVGCYVFILTINIFHFHPIDVNTDQSFYSKHIDQKRIDINFNSCPIQLAINLFNYSLISGSNFFFDKFDKVEIVHLNFSPLNLQKDFHFCPSLRAPPLFL